MAIVYAQSIAPEPKTKATTALATKVVKKTETQQMVDEYTDLATRLEESGMKAVIKRMDELSKSLRAKVEEIGADNTKPYVFDTLESTLEFSACTNSLEITDRNLLVQKLGQATFNAIARVSVTDLKKYLSPVEISSFAVPTFGHRTVKSYKVKVPA